MRSSEDTNSARTLLIPHRDRQVYPTSPVAGAMAHTSVLAAFVFTVATAVGQLGPQGQFILRRPGTVVAAGAGPGASSPEPVYPPQPYSFGYDNVDEYGTQSFHKEESDANNVKTGSYGYRDVNGTYRKVTYVADADGFRATVDMNEPGTVTGHTADAVFSSKQGPVLGAAKAASAPAAVYAASDRAPLSRGQPTRVFFTN
ncbi:larval cuticle protein A3A-like isoform X2 [Dermacentor albipictus]|uniref:larval cuticle protein A3A-like isoform X2 n=1 Tax=Dermacentor albipictus TaxID=60249 RepID=UPI0038FCEF93